VLDLEYEKLLTSIMGIFVLSVSNNIIKFWLDGILIYG
jgi:hypothetical protein